MKIQPPHESKPATSAKPLDTRKVAEDSFELIAGKDLATLTRWFGSEEKAKQAKTGFSSVPRSASVSPEAFVYDNKQVGMAQFWVEHKDGRVELMNTAVGLDTHGQIAWMWADTGAGKIVSERKKTSATSQVFDSLMKAVEGTADQVERKLSALLDPNCLVKMSGTAQTSYGVKRIASRLMNHFNLPLTLDAVKDVVTHPDANGTTTLIGATWSGEYAKEFSGLKGDVAIHTNKQGLIDWIWIDQMAIFTYGRDFSDQR